MSVVNPISLSRAARVGLVSLSLLAFADATAGAQSAARRAAREERIARRQAMQAPGAQPGAQRNQLEQQLRRRLWQVTKQRVGFTDEEMGKLEVTTRNFEGRRRALGQDEKVQRQLLRTEIIADSSANQERIAGALDRMLQIQQQRHELQAEEQKELATFMTPLQRAKYLALQEQVRKRVEQLRRQRPDSAGTALP